MAASPAALALWPTGEPVLRGQVAEFPAVLPSDMGWAGSCVAKPRQWDVVWQLPFQKNGQSLSDAEQRWLAHLLPALGEGDLHANKARTPRATRQLGAPGPGRDASYAGAERRTWGPRPRTLRDGVAPVRLRRSIRRALAVRGRRVCDGPIYDLAAHAPAAAAAAASQPTRAGHERRARRKRLLLALVRGRRDSRAPLTALAFLALGTSARGRQIAGRRPGAWPCWTGGRLAPPPGRPLALLSHARGARRCGQNKRLQRFAAGQGRRGTGPGPGPGKQSRHARRRLCALSGPIKVA